MVKLSYVFNSIQKHKIVFILPVLSVLIALSLVIYQESTRTPEEVISPGTESVLATYQTTSPLEIQRPEALLPTETPTQVPTPTATPTNTGVVSPESQAVPTTTPTNKAQNLPSLPNEMKKKVLVVVFNPTIPKTDEKIIDYQGWFDTTQLQQQYIAELKEASHGILSYKITKTIELNSIPVKNDGFQYSINNYLSVVNDAAPEHRPDIMNYQKIIKDIGACEMSNNGKIDEVWLWGGPWFGFYEHAFAGPSSILSTLLMTSPIYNTSCDRLLPIMGFSYHVDTSHMLHDFGHRFEAMLTSVSGSWKIDNGHAWSQFTSYRSNYSEYIGCGNVHIPPNGKSDYDYSNTNTVNSQCIDWLTYPHLTDETEKVSCANWGCNQLGYMRWWLSHIPHSTGVTDNIINNWWYYVGDYEKVY